MRINLIQMDVRNAEPHLNRKHAEELMRLSDKADVYILPEMFATGFVVNPEGIAEDMADGSCVSLEWMKAMASELDAAVAGSLSVRGGDNVFHNRFCFVRPDGKCTFYDKRHLFAYGGEKHCYIAGTERVVAEFRGVRFLLQICYDLRFPVFSRNRADKPYDAIIYVASWPASRQEAWLSLLRARAIENQCYVCAVNRVGSDSVCRYSGGTQMIDPYGNIGASCPVGQEGCASAYVDMEGLVAFRRKFPVLDDADGFLMD